ncbi:MAG: TIGR01459 family HAD-type hydrolase [Hyphomicrobiales bacterium]|nr:TIGR01459 family HAD-type hydrolase [Hyphomicrobiales bacterium]
MSRSCPHVAGLSSLVSRYDIILSDVWGVVHNGVVHTPAAADALQRFRAAGGTVLLITNAPRPRSSVVKLLDRFGLPHDSYDDVVSSGDVTVEMIMARGAAPLFHYGPERDLPLFSAAAERIGARPPLVDPEAADYVVCSGPFDDLADPDNELPLLRRLRARNLPFICANPDIVVHAGEELYWCAGALAERYEKMGGAVIMAGKPYPVIYEAALARAQALRGGDLDRVRVLAIGDGMFTDMKGAAGEQLDALFISSGVHRDALHARGAMDEAAFAQLRQAANAAPIGWMRDLRW